MRRFALAIFVLAPAFAAAPARAVSPPGTTCPVFPANNAWHADVTTLPVHPRSAQWIASMGGTTRRLHPDFGPSGETMPYGIPYDVVAGTHAKTSITFDYADESDPGPYPFGPDITIEMGSDRHAIMLDKDACKLSELFNATYSSSGSTAGSGAVFDLRSNALRPAGWTSADAAGLSIFAGLLRLDEVRAGHVDHAIRMTASRTDRSYLWPARHQAGAANDVNLPPMGAWFRLKGSYNISGFRADTQTVLRAMRKHGMIVADNGSNWYFTGTAEDGWDPAMLDELKSIPAGAFEAVDASVLRVSANSGEARPPTGYALPGTIEDANNLWRYGGSWYRNVSSVYSGGTRHWTNTPGSTADLKIAAGRLRLIATVGPNMGIASIYADGAFLTSVDLYARTTRQRVAVLDRQLGPGKHTIRIIRSGKKNWSSSAGSINIDALALS
jgi:hypothetical protein